jgi:glyoxylase-like metal-dependent hydrolase (beta-lactamase superfamily II)
VVQKPWHLDDLVIHRLVEDDTSYMTVEEFLPDLSRQTVLEEAEWLAREGLDPKSGIVYRSYHSYVVETPLHRVLVDTCIGNRKTLAHRAEWNDKRDTRWLEEFEATGLKFEDIDYVLCTHLHLDHVGWNTRLDRGRWVPTFPNARHLVVSTEYDSARKWPDKHPDNPSAEVFRASFMESVAPIVDSGQVDLVPPDFALGEYFRFMPTPGHTAGHSAISAGKGRDSAVFTGDLFHSPIQTVFPDTLMPFDDAKEQAATTRRSFLEHFSGTNTLLCTAHFPAPSVGRVHPSGDGYRFEFIVP